MNGTNKKWIVCIVMALLISSLSSCAHNEPADNKVYLDAFTLIADCCCDHETFFIANAPKIEETANVDTVDKNPEQKKELLFGETTVELPFDHADDYGDFSIYVYSSVGGTYKLYYFDDNKDIPMKIQLMDMSSFDNIVELNDASFLTWSKELLSQIYTEDWSIYTSSCSTLISYSEGSQAGIQIPSEEESVEYYTADFQRFINGYETVDVYRVMVYPQKMKIEVYPSEHLMDNVTEIDFDMDEINASIETYFTNYLDTGKYRFEKLEYISGCVTMRNNKLCYTYSIMLYVEPIDPDCHVRRIPCSVLVEI